MKNAAKHAKAGQMFTEVAELAGRAAPHNLELFRSGKQAQHYLGEVPLDALAESPWNPRKTREEKRVAELAAHIASAGYDVTRAVKVHRVDGNLLVFAGATRMLASRAAGLSAIPAFEFVGYSDEEIWRFAYEDNAHDGQHAEVPIVDVWADYAAKHAGGMTQKAIADALGVDRTTVVLRIGWHKAIQSSARRAVLDGTIDEGHLTAISGLVLDVQHLAPWLTTDQAQSELLAEVLGKHRGSSDGIKPTVRVVREAAGRWKAMIAAAEKAYADLDGEWRELFLAALIESKARTEAAVNKAHASVLAKKASEAADTATKAANAAEAAARVEAIAACAVLGDAREKIAEAPAGFNLLLTDPPYGVDFVSGRRTTTPKKSAIANDGKDEALALLRDVLTAAFPRMADDSTALVFTSWRNEPEFREVIAAVGFTIKGSLVWVKHNHGTGDLAGSFAPKHERIIHAVKGKPALRVRHPDVLTGKDSQNSEHPTEKPLDLLSTLIEATTDEEQTVVDPFAGSGSTLFAAFDLGRKFWGCEIDADWHGRIADALLKRAGDKGGA